MITDKEKSDRIAATIAKWKEHEKEVDEAGGMEGYYKKTQQEELDYWEQMLQNYVECDPRVVTCYSREELEELVYKGKLLFFVYKALKDQDPRLDFIGLTHTWGDYAFSVLQPMKELIEQGKIAEAIALYHQPRRYHR
jgi:hypothetical protein